MKAGDYVSVYSGTQEDGAHKEPMRAKVLWVRVIDERRTLAGIEFTSGRYKGEIPQPYVFDTR